MENLSPLQHSQRVEELLKEIELHIDAVKAANGPYAAYMLNNKVSEFSLDYHSLLLREQEERKAAAAQ